MHIKQMISRLFYPEGIKCIICGEELSRDTRYGICKKCTLPVNTKYCLKCGRAVKNMAAYCDNCMNNAHFFEIARAPFRYEDNIVAIVYKLKYGGGKFLAKYMAEFMADEYMRSDFSADMVTCVPMHKARLKSRGYNQAELLAKAVSEIIKVPFSQTLNKEKNVANLAKMNKKERAENILDAFTLSIDYQNIKNKNILLIDDVMTTGATSDECCRMLRKAKVGKIFVLTFASVPFKPFLY